ncbi:MAG: transcription-repair coupling factor [Bacilli bacterium]
MPFLDNIFSKDNYKNVSGLTDELKCLYIANNYNLNKKAQLVVCNSLYEANKFYQALKNYTDDVLLFPMDDFMTSEVLAVSPDFKIMRLETLNALKDNSQKIVVTNLMGYLRFLPSKNIFINSYISLNKNLDIDINILATKLYNIGYKRETLVNKSGEIAIRGFVVDIFPINSENPIRIEFWGDTIDSIRIFDIDTQLTKKEIENIKIMPNNEFLIEKDISFDYVHRDLIKYTKPCNIRDYFNEALLVYNNYRDLKVSYDNLLEEIKDYCLTSQLVTFPKFMMDFNELNIEPNINLCNFDDINDIAYKSHTISEQFNKLSDINKALNHYLKDYKYVVICVSTRYQVNKIMESIENNNFIFTNPNNIYENKINIIIKNINEGFIINDFVVISEKEIFNKKEQQAVYKTNFKYGTRIKDITKLNIGDYVVHNIHGVGHYCGIKTITKNNLIKDYLQIEYRGGDKLYIPVEKIDMISKYSSNDYEPKMNKLGTTEWENIKLKARAKAADIAGKLLNLYALREISKGFAFEKDDENQLAFEKEFPFTETYDQIKVTDEIKKDMESPHPMDRLLCADVGYGKTEVAFRAAFKAILSGKQVALLCPTTILSNQHYQNALERFKSFPVNIKLLNRFVTNKEVNETITNLKQGKVDFVIGTHKLLNKDIVFKELGLLIIDEEQRFGVTHKEKIKQYKSNVDVLTLSATPIPRTLQMSMSGIRSLSLIETPPSNRYPVQTYVLAYNKKVIKDAIYKELSRQGQTFLLYNHVDNIENKVREIKELVPEAKIIFAHGRMNKKQLEDVMFKFTNKEYDVLVCTTIIETGIDIPNVNTLIIIDADRFGLSQLYQLRGRVGRTNKLAYCYLMYDQQKILSEIANKRLTAIKEFTELGSGLSIAMRDLSIRGAGDILGSEQAGFIDSIGIELFMKMLKEEIDKLKGKVIKEEITTTQPLVDVDTFVSDEYVLEEDLKIEIHKKINEIDSHKKLKEVEKELIDRFGKLSDKLIIYMHEEWFEHLANELDIKKVNQTANYVEIVLNKEMTKKINGEQLFMATLAITNNFRFKMQYGSLIIILNFKNLEKHFIYYLIDLLLIIKKAI